MNDPFANLDKATSEEPKKQEQVSAADYFLDINMVMEEEDYEQPAAFVPYEKPAHKAWIPVQILVSKIGIQELRRVLTDPDTGAETIKDKVSTPRFEMEAQHVAECYGERGRNYLLGMPIDDVKLAYKEGSKRNGLGWKKQSGRKLLAATRVLKPGEKLDPKKLEEVTESMVGKIVMAQVRRVDRDYTDAEPVKDENGRTIRVQADASEIKIEIVQKDGQFVMKSDGTPYPGDPSRLVKYEDTYYIPDMSGDGVLLKKVRMTTRTFDNLEDDVAPVPGMVVEADALDGVLDEEFRAKFTIRQLPGGSVFVERLIPATRVDGTAVYAQVTWDTVGQIATKPIKAGTPVQAVTAEGELLTATWIGTLWNETPVAHKLEINDLGEVTFVPVEDDSATPDKGDPLDIFKGDSAD